MIAMEAQDRVGASAGVQGDEHIAGFACIGLSDGHPVLQVSQNASPSVRGRAIAG